MNDYRLTTFDNPYNPFEQFSLWYMFDCEQGYNTCSKIARIANIKDDMSDKEIEDEYNRAIEVLIDNDFLNIYKKVQRSMSMPA